MSDDRLYQQVALITGGTRGIGEAIANRFWEEGAVVVICGRNKEDGEKIVKYLGTRAYYYKVDVTDRQNVEEWIYKVSQEFGIDILVNNAGTLRDNLLVKVRDGELVKQMTEDEFDQVIATNLKGIFNCTQMVAPVMIHQKRGVILNASSFVGLDGGVGVTNYAASKSGVIAMTKVWARELGRYGIRVNAVAPGCTDNTGMIKNIPEKRVAEMVAHTPLGRLASPQEIANAYLFLASDEASFITGQVLRVDGGLVLGT